MATQRDSQPNTKPPLRTFPLGLAWYAALADRRRYRPRALTAREFEQARQRLREAEERRAREADIATCECGGSVRHDGREWVHVGKCGIIDRED